MPKSTIQTNLTLGPVARAALMHLATLGGTSASAYVARLLWEELERRHPGAWERASHAVEAARAANPAAPLERLTHAALAAIRPN